MYLLSAIPSDVHKKIHSRVFKAHIQLFSVPVSRSSGNEEYELYRRTKKKRQNEKEKNEREEKREDKGKILLL